MRRSCCGSRPRGVPDEFRIGREIRGLAERARTADDEYKEHLTTVNIGTVGTFSVTVRNTASGLSPTASPLASLRVLPRRRRPSRASVTPRIRPSPANHSRSPLAGPTSTPQVPRCSLEVLFTVPGGLPSAASSCFGKRTRNAPTGIDRNACASAIQCARHSWPGRKRILEHAWLAIAQSKPRLSQSTWLGDAGL